MGNIVNKDTNKTYLSEKDLIFLEEHTNFDREKIIKWHNAFILDCPSGTLDKKQFVKLYNQLEPAERKVEKYAEYVFKAFDSNHNGTIEFTEFLLAFNLHSKGSLDDRLNWCFTIYDIDGNDEIDRKELKRMVELLFTMLNVDTDDEKYTVDKKVDEILSKLDVNTDRKISRDEFVKGVRADESLRRLFLEHEID